ncbi:MAG: ubiquinone-binding protein [marine bacterium B5-7]|nr:MAG: ubiquinone-binding protein [marine bacterium B5-7]
MPYTATEMFSLVDDVEQYPEFLPWCGGSAVLSRDDHSLMARVDIDFKGLRKSFVTENRNTPDELIEIRLKEGPFKSLEGKWHFYTLGPAATRVSLDIDFEFSSVMIDRMLGSVFKHIAGSMVDSFVKRAERLYGRRELNIG